MLSRIMQKRFSAEYIQAVVARNSVLFVWKNIQDWRWLVSHFFFVWATATISWLAGPSPERRSYPGIARAFLKNAPVLLLDEPTSALDPATEAAIMETIKDLMRGRTTLIATHRLATIHDVDRIVVLERGRIVEQGRGTELLARGGVYAKLFTSGKFPT